MYKAYFAIEKKLKSNGYDFDRSELISEFTNQKTDSLRALSAAEYREFILWLNKLKLPFSDDWQKSPENIMRRKVYSLFVFKMGYTKARLDQWCLQYGKHHKRLNDHSHDELIELVTQAENVYVTYIKAID